MLLIIIRILIAMGIGVVIAFALFGASTYRNLKGRDKHD